MFLRESTELKLLSVLEVSWAKTDTNVKGRHFHALSFRVQGDGTITQSIYREQLKTGDILFMPKGADYHLQSEPEKIIVVHFEANGIIEDRIKVYRPENPVALHRSFSALFETWNQKLPGHYFRAMSMFYHILDELSGLSAAERGADYEKIRPAVEYIHSHYNDPDLSAGALCKRVFMSDTYFRKLFFRIYGKTPLYYINDLRIDYAKELLREWNSSVGQVAAQVGFSDAKYFSTVFKARTGLTPTAYQKSAF